MIRVERTHNDSEGVVDIVSCVFWTRDVIGDLQRGDIDALVDAQLQLHPHLDKILRQSVKDTNETVLECDLSIACIAVLFRDSVYKKLDHRDIQRVFDCLSSAHDLADLDAVSIFRFIQRALEWLDDAFGIKAPRTSHNLPEVKGYARIKEETLHSGPGGIHHLTPEADLPTFIQDRIERGDCALHLIVGSKSRFILDIDVKREDLDPEEFKFISE